jgi:sugar phosphate isomerase/epimerase
VAAVAFDVGNVICRGEDPIAAARRVARHTRLTHVKDAILVADPGATFTRWLRPCGVGMVDWPALLALLAKQAPGELTLTLEDNQNPKLLEPHDPAWRGAHPDLPDAELESLLARAQTGIVDDASRPRWNRAERLARLHASRDALRSLAP